MTYKKHLDVYIIVQIFVRIAAVVLIVRKFEYFVFFWLENACSCPRHGVFGHLTNKIGCSMMHKRHFFVWKQSYDVLIIKIGQTVASFLIFSRWWPSTILDMWSAFWDDPHRVFGCLYHCAKFGCNHCIGFDSMEVWIFCTFGLKKPIPTPKWAFWGLLTS